MLTTDSLPDITDLPQPIRAALNDIPPSEHYYVALSGGMDSVALLLSASVYFREKNLRLKAIHVHHGLSSNADEWASFCSVLCGSLGIECLIEKVKVIESGQGLEAAARKARYEVFERYIEEGAVLLQGHHLNDQAESFLLKASKGMGPEALAGIPKQRSLARGCLYRPFLQLSREALLAWAQTIGMEWVEDESNLDTRFDRNFLRQTILPELDRRWPSISERLSQTASRTRRLVEQQSLWNEHYLNQMKLCDDYGYEVLPIDKLTELPEPLQRSVVRYWIDAQGRPQPPESSFDRIWTELLCASEEAQPEICWGQLRLVRFNTCLYLVAAAQEEVDYEHVVSVGGLNSAVVLECGMHSVSIKEGELQDADASLISLAWPSGAESLVVRNRRGGERFKQPGSPQRTSLKNCFQTWKTPPWLRNMPLVFFGDQLVFVGCGKVADGFASKSDGRSVSISLKPLA